MKKPYLIVIAAGLCWTRVLSAQQAGIEVLLHEGMTFESIVLKKGERLFTDREYVLAEEPALLKGESFLRHSIDGVRVRCTQPGTIMALTPPNVKHATSQRDILIAYGFEQLNEPDSFQLFGANAHERVNIYRKTLRVGETLRLGKWCVLLGYADVKASVVVKKPWAENDGEKLYNNIVLPQEWPPLDVNPKSDDPMPVPYLSAPPNVINIDVGRQLFIDNFLIESTDLLHMYHLPEKYDGNPILECATALERQEGKGIFGGVCRPCVWWNPVKECFYLWYQAGTYFQGTIALATSTDGLNWTRPELNVMPGSNQALPIGFQPDSYGIVADWHSADPQQRFKLFSTNPGSYQPATCFTSADGVNWINQTTSGTTGDRSSMFYNPFRKKWIFSLRSSFRGRSRNYRESSDFLEGAKWNKLDTVPWLAADSLDAPEPGYNHKTQLYNFDAVAYESVMLGFFELHRGPDNKHCAQMGLPKLNEISFGYSRDGFHFSRPDRRAHIPASRKDAWDRGFVESGGNICAVVGDKLYFYHSGCRGDIDGALRPDGSLNSRCMYDRNAIGVSVLRRDGFASLFAGASEGVVTTRPLVFSGSRMFVNVDCPQGELRVEILDEENRVIESFNAATCVPISVDSTLAPVVWQGAASLADLVGRPVRFRFHLRRGALYSFWVSRDSTGRSDGYVAGGGPGYKDIIDTVGALR